jgi:ribosome biogenesis protein Nip4
VITFKFDKKREERFKSELEKIFGSEISKIFVDKKALFADGNFTEVFLVGEQSEKLIKSMEKYPYSAGLFVGKIIGKEIKPSLQLLKNTKKFKNSIIVGPKAEQRFLFGKDIASKEVVWTSELLGEETVVVLNESGEPLGYGKALTNSSIIKKLGKEIVVENLDDLGWYLRQGG